MKTKTRFSKQILSVLLCITMLLSYVPMTAFAAEGGATCTHTTFTDGKCVDCGITGGYCGAATNEGGEQSVIWTYDEATKSFAITGTGAIKDFDSYSDRPWDGTISDNAASVTISEGVTRIGEDAFHSFYNITNVTIPASVESIGRTAFTNCSSMQSITFAEGSRLTTLDNYVFQQCSKLQQITLPAGVTSIGSSTFSWCNALTDIFVEDGNTALKDIDGVLYTADGTTLLLYPAAKEGTEFITPAGVTTIGEYAFEQNVNLKTITLSEGVTTIRDEAFIVSEALETLNLPESLTTMGDSMINGCAKLTTIALPETLTKIDEGAFCGSSLTEIHIPASVTSIGAYAFSESHNLTAVVIPQGVTTIGEYAFYWMDSLTTVTIPASVTNIGEKAFYYSKNLTTVNAPCNWDTANPLYTFESTVTVTVGDHTPNADGSTDNNDGTHSFTCFCGKVVTEDHSGGDGTATCVHGKVCDKCSEYYGDFIEHHYSYTADDETNTVTVTCDQGCGLNQTVKLSAPENAVYTGEKIEATVTGAAGIDHSLTYNVDPVNAGDYTATLTVGNKSVSVEYTIAKATPTYEVPTGLTATYGDTLADVDLPAGWTWKDEGTTSVGNAGTRTFKALYNPDSDNYNTVEADVTIDVAKADIDFNTVVDPVFATGLVYNGTAQALVTKTGYVEGGTIVYSLSPDGEYTTTIPVATEAGEYVVYWCIKGDENHNDYGQPGATYITVYITDATDPTGEILIKENSWKKFLNWISFGLFCKDNVDVIVTADGTGSAVAKVEYLFSTTALDENNLPADGWVTVDGDDGTYKFAITAQNKGAVYVKITDAYGNVAVINSDGIVVYADSKAIDTEVHTTYGSVQNIPVKVELNGNTVADVKFGTQSFIDDGYCTVSGDIITLNGQKISRLGAGSYEIIVSYHPMGVENSGVTDLTTTFTLVIDKADGSVTGIEDISKTYDGTPVSAPTFEQLGNGVATIEYKVKDAADSTYTTNAPTNAGDYVVCVTVAEDNNHKAASATAEFTISPANLETAVITLDKDTFVYDGTAHKPDVTVTFNGVTLAEGVDYEVTYQTALKMFDGKPIKWFSDWTDSADCIHASNSYYAVVKGIGNYYTKDLFTLYAPFVIKKATVTEPTIASKPYTGAVQTADVADTDLYTVEQNNGGTEKGSYDVVLKLKDSANYKWSTTDNAEVTLQFVISAAQNAWDTNPSISSWTYGEVANAPVYEAKFGTVKVVYTGTANDGSDYNSETAPTKAGNYRVTFSVEGTEDYTGLSESVGFTIAKANQVAPAGLEKTDETISKKTDGTISGLTTKMEYCKGGENTYMAATESKLENLEAGKYYVRYATDSNHNASPEMEIAIATGRKLTVTIPQNQVGYTLTVDKTEFDYDDTITINFTFNEGYTPTDDFAVKYNNNPLPLRDNNRVDLSDCTEDIVITVEGVQDTTYPTAEISIKDNKWTAFWNNLTFGLFFNDTQEVTITSADKGSGVNAVYYYLADRELALNEVKAITDWQEYNGTFKINPDNKYVIYVKVVDNEDNTSYINSNGIVLDATKPAMYGIENGGVYYGDKVFKALDDYLKTLKVDGVDVTAELNGDNEYKIIADNAEHTVTAIDQAGNVTEYKITVYKNYTVTYKIDGETIDTQTIGYGKDAVAPTIPAKEGYTQTAPAWDKDGKNITADTEINAVYTINKYTVTYKADGEVVETVTVEHGKDATAPAIPEKVGYTQTAPVWDKDGKNITADTEINAVYTINEYTVSFKADGTEISTATVKHGEDATLPEIPKKDGFVGKWDKDGKDITDDTVISVVYTEIAEVIPEQVKPEDKTELEDTKKQLEDMLDDDNYTEDDKKEIQDAIDGIDEALEIIENVEATEELINKIPENITKNDEAAIKAADEAYNALTDYEKSLVDEDAKKALDDAKSALAELNKPADPNSPQTGDNSNLWLWFALLFVSGTGIFAITVYDRKRRAASKR